jgi:hypothetical protein
MRGVYERFPEDLDVAALYADALMNLKPWKLWDPKTKKPTLNAPTNEVQRVLEKALKADAALRHPGLIHLHIHFWEMSPRPERALPIADLLRNLVPDAGHLQHMPSHLDVLCMFFCGQDHSSCSPIKLLDKGFVMPVEQNVNFALADKHL